MTLQKQEVEIPLNGGQDAKKSTELGDPSTMLSVTNLRWDRIGELEKRPTYASTATPAVPSGANYSSVVAEAIFARGDEVFTLTDNFGIAWVDSTDPTALRYARRDISGYDVAKYSPRACKVSRKTLERSQFGKSQAGIYQVTSAVYDDVLVVAWIEVAATRLLKYKAVDLATGTTIATTQQTSLTSTFCAVHAIPYYESGSQGVLITYSSGAAAPFTIKTIRYDASTKTFVADSNLTTNSKYVTHTLATSGSSNMYLAFTDNTTNALKAHRGTISQINGGTSTVHSGVTTGTSCGAIVVGPTRVLLVTYTAAAVYVEVFGTPANYVSALSATSPEGFFGVTAALEGTSDYAIVFANAYGTETWGSFSRVYTIPVAFTSTTPAEGNSDYIPNTWLATEAFTVDDRCYVGTALDLQQSGEPTSVIVSRYSEHTTADVIRQDAVARILHDRYYAADAGVFSGFAPVSVDGTSVHIVLPGDPSADAEANYGAPLPQVLFHSKIDFRSGAALPLPSAEVDNTTLIASGLTIEWDGDTPSEHAPIHWPTAFVDATVAGTTTTTQTCSVKAIWRWTDAQGRLHRSTPSDAKTLGIVTSKRFDVYVTKPPFSAYDSATSLHTIEPELYVTAEGGSVYYLANTGTSEKLVFTTSLGVWWKFQGVLPGVVGNPQLYSTGADGGEVLPEPPPSFRDITKVGDRLLAIDAEDPTRIWYTKPFSAGFAPEWSSVFTLFIGDDGVAIRDMGGVPTVFGARGLHQIYGEGPDSTGNGSFSPARRLPYEVGCIDPLVCKTSLGTVFRGRRGFYLLDNALGLQPLGLPIDQTSRVASTSGYTYARVINDELHNEIRVIDADGGHYYVFNTVESKWSEWLQSTTAQKAVDACVADGRVWYLHDTGSARLIRREYGVDESGYNTSDESWTIGTSWLKLDGVAGQIRLWRAWLSLALPSDSSDISNVTVSYSTDYGQAVQQTFVWTGAELDALYNFSAGDVTAQLAMVPAQQVARAVKFAITVTFTGASAGPRPLGLRLRYGVRDTKSKRTRPGVK